MKVLLVASPKNYFGMDMYIRIPNLGLCSIAGNIDDGIAEVHILDLIVSGKNYEKYFTKIVKKLNPDIIGFSSMIFQYKSQLSLAKIAKSINSEVTIIFGGYYPTIDFDTIGQNGDMKYIDFLICGEGELSFNEFLKAFSTSKDYTNVPGLTYKKNGNVFHNSPGCLVNLDEMKFPNRSARILNKGFHCMGLKADVIETSRGCVYDCNFCSIGMMYGKSFRKFKIERVIEDIKSTRESGAKVLMMTDDNITIDGKRFKELCYAIKDSGLNNIKYFVQASIKGIKNTPGLVKAMAEAGIKWVFLGIENVSDTALDSMNKSSQFDAADTVEVLRELKKYHILVVGGFIVGNPDDNEESLWSNFEFAKKLKIDFPIFNTITPYPKTPIREDLLKLDLITNPDDYTRYDCWEVNVKTKYLSTEQIYSIRQDMSLRYPLESKVFYTFVKEFPLYSIIMLAKWLYAKPSDIFKGVVRGLSKRNNKNIIINKEKVFEDS